MIDAVRLCGGHYEHFSHIKSYVAVDDEVSNCMMQLVQDLAADYHRENGDEAKHRVVSATSCRRLCC